MTVALSVKHKILFSLWLTTFLLLVLAGTVTSVWFIQDQAGRLDEFLAQEVRSVQETLGTYFAADGREGPTWDSVNTVEFRAFLDNYLQGWLNRPLPYKTTLGIFDPQGNRAQVSNLALDLSVTGLPTSEEPHLVTIQGTPPYRMTVVPLSHNGAFLGTIRMACPTISLAEVLNSFLISLSVVLGLIFVSFGLLGTILIHWSLQPVRRLSLSAHEISETHLNLRLAVPTGRDEVAQMATTLNHLLARLEQDYQFEEALVGQLSHELRTPLTILRGRNEVTLERLTADQGAMQRVLEDNLADIDNIVTLLNTLLNLARLEGRIDPIKLRPCDLALILKDTIEELIPLWEEKDLSFKLSFPGKQSSWSRCPALPSQGDPVLLRQVFLNILTNAYKYSPRGSRIHVTVDDTGGEFPLWSFVFRNSGPALPEESLDLVFKRFYRVEVQDPDRFEQDSGLGQKGFGLGLSIAKTMVELHNGRIRAFNPETGGAAFEVLLPQTN